MRSGTGRQRQPVGRHLPRRQAFSSSAMRGSASHQCNTAAALAFVGRQADSNTPHGTPKGCVQSNQFERTL